MCGENIISLQPYYKWKTRWNIIRNIYTLKNAGLFQLKFGSNMDKPKCWVKNAFKKCTVESESSNWKLPFWLHFISIVTLDVLLIISNFSTTCQQTLIRVLVYYSRLSVDC